MARKKRLTEVPNLPPTQLQPPVAPVVYEDAFQHAASRKILNASEKLEGKGKTILIALGALLGLIVIGAIALTWNKRSNSVGQTALGKAVELTQSPISQQPVPTDYPGKVFKSEKERSEAAIAEFQRVAATYGGDVAQKAKYFAAVNQINLDRNAGIASLEQLQSDSGDTGVLAKFALAQIRQGDGQYDQALAVYNELLQSNSTVISKDTINFEIGSIYEKQGKTAEAIEAFYTIAKKASELKDSQGKALPLVGSARAAKNKLDELDPAKGAEIKEELPANPFG